MFSINKHNFELNIVNPYDSHLQRSDGSYSLGCTDLDNGSVYIREGLDDALFDKVLSHELVHCFCLAYGYHLDYDTEELCADFLATYGRDVFNVTDDILDRMMRDGRNR